MGIRTYLGMFTAIAAMTCVLVACGDDEGGDASSGTNTGGTGAANIAEFPQVPAFAPSSGPQPPTQNAFNAANFVRSASPSGAALSTLPSAQDVWEHGTSRSPCS